MMQNLSILRVERVNSSKWFIFRTKTRFVYTSSVGPWKCPKHYHTQTFCSRVLVLKINCFDELTLAIFVIMSFNNGLTATLFRNTNITLTSIELIRNEADTSWIQNWQISADNLCVGKVRRFLFNGCFLLSNGVK